MNFFKFNEIILGEGENKMELNIGEKIKAFRLKNNLSQSDLCSEELNRVILSRIENNKMLPSIPQLIYISEKLKLPFSYFLEKDKFNISNYDEVNDKEFHCKLKSLLDDKNYLNIISLYEKNPYIFNNKCNFIYCYYLGIAYFNLEFYVEATTVLKSYLSSYLSCDKSTQKDLIIFFANALNTLMKISYSNDDFLKCEQHLALAIKYLRIFDQINSEISFILHNNLGLIYNKLHKFTKTINLLEGFLVSTTKTIHIDALANIHGSLTIAYYNLDNYQKSIDHCQQSIFLFSYMKDTEMLVNTYLNYINSIRYNNDLEEALRIINDCKLLFKDNYTYMCKIKMQELTVLFNMCRYDEMISLSKLIKINDINNVSKANYYFMMGHIDFIKSNSDAAIKKLKKCEKIFISNNYGYDLLQLYIDLYSISGDKNMLDKFNNYSSSKYKKNILIKSPKYDIFN